jgi:peptide/nickel transport system permease protein
MTMTNVKVNLDRRIDQGKYLFARLTTSPKATVALAILAPITLISIFGPYVVPHGPTETNVANAYASPSLTHPFGTDHLGRDLLSRVIVGGRVSLFLGFAATALALAIGVPIGLTAGYTRGVVDEFLMRTMDILMSFPTLLLALLILMILPPNIWNIILAVGIVYSPRVARVVRSATLDVRNKEFVLAAKARNESSSYIMFREILPNILAPIMVEGSVRFGFAILVGTSLSFLGLGTQPPNADWGYMVATARLHMADTIWFLFWPSIALGLTIFSVNLLGDGLRDVFDVKQNGDTQ